MCRETCLTNTVSQEHNHGMFPEKHVGFGAQSVMVQLLFISQMQLRYPTDLSLMFDSGPSEPKCNFSS